MVRALVAGIFATAAIASADGTATRAETLDVYTAASAAAALQEVADGYTEPAVRIVAAATSALARQIEHGAPADLFISANIEWMEYLDSRGLLAAETRRTVLLNRLVLIAPRRSPFDLAIEPGFDLAGALGAGRLAVADPAHVPAGTYAREALITLGVWEVVRTRLAPTQNVISAVTLVARGETPAGIVYESDSHASDAVTVVGFFPTETHTPVRYEAAVVKGAREGAAAFLDYLTSPEARAVFRRFGFTLPESPG
ncbi:MAG TPA: molybdate ABC transporter substrate-binding protein [Alphaproteobacteria bacterium]|jgi:molybdate transport system substrate-binding protein|nr:molybdate ABC transporter substrate-binding protein [Alphaproteobacteria bacterium]